MDRIPRFIESVDEFAEHWPLIADVLRANDHSRWPCCPWWSPTAPWARSPSAGPDRPPFDDEERSFLSTLASQAGQALERARLTLIELDDALRAVRLQQLSSALARAATPEEVAAAGIAEGISALGAKGGTVRVPTRPESTCTW